MEARNEVEPEIIDVEEGEKETCLVGTSASKRRKKVEGTPTTLPHDIIENILSLLPVKYLIRFKVVSKLWEATISDPRFAEKHLQRYKNSSSRNLHTLPLFGGRKGLDVVELQNDYFRSVSRIEHSREDSSGYVTLCSCDGLFLQHCRVLDEIETYVLWNPSCRAYKEIFCPQEIDDSNCSTIYGIYYNPLKKDYMVVIADKERYAVFSCRCNEWSEVKAIEGVTWNTEPTRHKGVSCNGSFYWSFLKIEGRVLVGFDIIYFDGKDEKIKKLALPDCKGEVVFSFLTSSGSHICLVNTSSRHYNNEARIMKKLEGDGKDSWMEIKLQYCTPPLYPVPICWVSEDEIILRFNKLSRYVLYDLRKNTFLSVHNCRYFEYDYMVPYLENLFIQ